MPLNSTWRVTQYDEMLNTASPVEAWAPNQSRANRTIRTAWDFRKQAVWDFLGYTEVVIGTSGTKYLSRTVPHNYPGEDKIWCTDIPRIVGSGPIGQTGLDSTMLAAYTYAELTLTYTASLYNHLTDAEMVAAGYVNAEGEISEGVALQNSFGRYVIYKSKPGIRQLVLNRSAVKRSDTGAPLLEGVPVPVPYEDIELTWLQIPEAALNTAVWGETQGCLNDDTFLGRDAETLLMEAPEIIRREGLFGAASYDVVFRMRYYPQFDYGTPPTARGWNYILAPIGDPATASLDMVKMVTNTAGTVSPFRTADFTRCFEPAQ